MTITAQQTKVSRGRADRWLNVLKEWLSTPVYVLATIIVMIAILAPVLAPYGPIEILPDRLQSPSLQHWFGTDQNGMDVFSRVLYGARIDLTVALSAAALAVIIGVPLGAFAAYRADWADNVLMRGVESIQAFPTLLLGMAVLAAVGSSLINLVLVITLVNIPVYIKLTRSAVLPIRNSDYVHAARCAGNSSFTIIRRHILPNVHGVVFAQFPVNCAWAIQILAALSFIGLGVRVPQPEWGAMIKVGVDYIVFGGWWISVFPGLAIFVTVLTLNRLGEHIRTKWQGSHS
jgi:peptide/nickel transport system permease protein